jgi:type II secretory pathway pseudopilin PulG
MNPGDNRTSTGAGLEEKCYSPFWAIWLVFVALAFWQALSFVDDSQDRDRLMLTENQLRASLSQVRAVNQTLDAVGRELVVLAPDSFEAARIVNEYKIKVGPVQPAK